MKVNINKDFLTEYKDDVWKGFSMKELITLIVAAFVAGCVVCLLHFKFGIEPATAVYGGVPAAIPVILFGFFKYQGYLNPVDFIREIIFTGNVKLLTYETAESARPVKMHLNRDACGKREKKKEKHDKPVSTAKSKKHRMGGE